MSLKKILSIGTIILAGSIVGAYILMSTYDYDSLKPQIAAAVKEATGRELELGEKINLQFGLSPALVLGNIALQNAPWGSRPDMVYVKRLEIQVALLPLILGRIDIKRFVLIQPDILIETDRSGRSNFSFEARKQHGSSRSKTTPPAGGPLRLPALTVEEVNIQQGQVIYRNGRSGSSHVLEISRLTAGADSAGSLINLKLKSVYNQLPFEITGTLGSWAAFTSTQDCPLNLTGTLGKIDLTVKGIIKDVPHQRHMELQVQARGKDLSDLKPLVDEPMSSQGPFETSFRITDPSIQVYRVSDLKVLLGPSDLSGSMEIDLTGERPMVSGVLASKTLDLRPLLPEEKAGTAGAANKIAQGTRREKVFSKTPLPLDVLGEGDVVMKAQADKVLLPEIAIDTMTADIAIKGGELKINPFKATVGGGTLNASLDLEPVGASALLKTEMKAEQVDLGRMMKELGKKGDSFEGRFNMHMEVNAKGVSEAEVMSTLNGRVVLTLSHGRIDNRYIDLVGGDISSSMNLLLYPFSERADSTAINCLVSGFNVRDGVATTTAFLFDTQEMSVVGDGDVDLRTEELNLLLKPVPKGGLSTGIPGIPKLGIEELARPLRLAGTLAHPSLRVDTTGAAETIAKAIGGIALFGPAGILATLVAGGSGAKDLCRVASEAAQKGVKLSAMDEKAAGKGLLGEAAKGLEEGLGAVGKGLEELFGK